MSRRSSAIRGGRAVLVLALVGHTPAALAYLPGDDVVVIADAHLTVQTKQVDNVWPGLVLKVGAVNGKWLWLSHGKPGWLDQRHVIPLNRAAVDRLTVMVRANPEKADLYQSRQDLSKCIGRFWV